MPRLKVKNTKINWKLKAEPKTRNQKSSHQKVKQILWILHKNLKDRHPLPTCPTREVCKKIYKVIYTISRYIHTHTQIYIYLHIYIYRYMYRRSKSIYQTQRKPNTNNIIFDFICIIVMYSVAKSKAEAKTNLLTTKLKRKP